MAEEHNTKLFKVIEIVNGRSNNYAILFMISLLCISGRLITESDFAFIASLIAIGATFLFTLTWNIAIAVKKRRPAQCKTKGDLCMSLLSQLLFIGMCVSWWLHNQVFIEVMAYLGALSVLGEALYLIFRNGSEAKSV